MMSLLMSLLPRDHTHHHHSPTCEIFHLGRNSCDTSSIIFHLGQGCGILVLVHCDDSASCLKRGRWPPRRKSIFVEGPGARIPAEAGKRATGYDRLFSIFGTGRRSRRGANFQHGLGRYPKMPGSSHFVPVRRVRLDLQT